MTELCSLTATEIATGLRKGQFSAVEVVDQTLARLSSVNPTFNAVVQEMPDEALAKAKEIDQAIARGNDPGPLAGVPVTIKVNVDQAGYANTNGIRLLKDNIADQDNPVVANLKSAGAVVIGRTNTPAFSMRWFTRNSLHGHTLNPRNKNLTPGGSSGGAAAAVAAGIGAIGHGTDIAGSVRYPAYACGLQGLRPTLGRVPALNASLPDRHIGPQITAVSGPITRSVDDIELALKAMSQPSALDPWWVPVVHSLGEVEKKAALCTCPDGMDTHESVVSALTMAGECLVDAGWEVIETETPAMQEPMNLQIQLWMAEYLMVEGRMIKEENDPDGVFVYEQLAALCELPTQSGFMDLLQKRVQYTRDWMQFMQQYPILICPNSASPPFPDLLDVESEASFRKIVNDQMPQIAIPFVSVPAISVCTGHAVNNPDVPMGVQLVADRYREDVLLMASREIESRCDPIRISDPD